MLYKKINELIILVYASSITFYAAKYTQFSPIYSIYLLLLLPSIIILLACRKIFYSLDMLIASILIFYITISQFNFLISGEYINLIISICSYLFIRANCQKIDLLLLIKILSIMIRVAIFFISIDTAYRIANPMFPDMDQFDKIAQSENLWFYVYKFNTFMFADSNATGLVVVILLFLIISLERLFNKKLFTYEKYILLILIFLSISRAAYVATFLGWIWSIISRRHKFNLLSVLLIIFSLFLVSIVMLFLFKFEISDDSLDTKFGILELTYYKINQMSFSEFFFGVGFGQSPDYLGVYSHLLFITYFIESGLIGLLLFLIFIINYIYRFNSIIWAPVLIVGLSYFTYLGTPFLFVPLALFANVMTKFHYLRATNGLQSIQMATIK